jgi:hypothetical protein
MDTQSCQVTYFAEPGPQNTESTFAAVQRRAEELGLRRLVIASDTGKTAREAIARFPDWDVVVVTNPAGLQLPVAKLHDYLPRFAKWKQSFIDAGQTKIPCSLSAPVVSELEGAGARVERIDWRQLVGYTRDGLRAMDWVGVGVRVAVTVCVWAHLAGGVPTGEEVLGLAGTGFGGGGADTAVVVRTAQDWKDWRVLETIVRPRESPPTER